MPKEKAAVEEPLEITAENAEEIARKEHEAEKAAEKGEEAPKKEEKKDKETPPKEEKPEETLEKKEEEGKPEEKAKTDEQLLDAKDEDLNKEEKTRKGVLITDLAKKDEEATAENNRILNTEDDKLKDKEKARKQELLIEKGKEIQEQQKAQGELDKLVKTYAKENDVSEEEAKEELESIGKIEEKYGKDSKKLAKANLHIQRLYSKAQEDLQTLQQKVSTPPLTVETVIAAIKDGKIDFKDGKKMSAEDVVAAYRDQHPEITEKIEDDNAVLRMAAKEMKEHLESARTTSLADLKVKAKEKKDALIAGLSEEDKKLLPTMQPLLDKMPDTQVMVKDFDLKDLVQWAKGNIDVAKVRQEGYEEGFRAGRATRPKIKTGPVGLGAGTGGGDKTGGKDLSDAQKDEALEMYPSTKTPEEAYELYADSEAFKKSLKDKKKGKE